MKMDPQVKARWVKALRSGEYNQTREKLKDCDGYCCLGVLCDLYAKDAGMKTWNTNLSDREDGQIFNACGYGDSGIPGARVAIWAGLDMMTHVRIGDKVTSLADHNDDGRTFNQIAKAIENQL